VPKYYSIEATKSKFYEYIQYLNNTCIYKIYKMRNRVKINILKDSLIVNQI